MAKFSRTLRGQRELRRRRLPLPWQARALLILIDRTRHVEDCMRQVPGSLACDVALLADLKLIALEPQ